jgi:hypothetical protein
MVGPDLEPLESESRRRAHPPGARHDSLTVAGAGGELVVGARLVFIDDQWRCTQNPESQ